ncbi:MAG: hypothetical protein IJI07_05870 [Flexilinea sp.]|nr:hypothetical protein [Flexilinea sp.]
MKKFILMFILMSALLSAVIPVFAEEKLIWSNFNTDPVRNEPKYYGTFPVPEDHAPVLITRIRTYHWNNGNGAEPGTICAREGNTTKELQCWQAVGRSAYGVPNVYWEVLTDFLMEPGQTYGFRVSDFDSWSNNEASKYFGMIELYGEDPAPSAYNTSASGYSSSTVPSNLSVGQTFTMGRYEQDNNSGNGKEPIEWQVLTIKNGDALVISKYGLEVIDHLTLTESTTWDTSAFRAWLNGDFYNTSFSDAEKSRIQMVTNENMANPVTGIRGGNRTQDRIFLLAVDEADYYFRTKEDRKTAPTTYAKAESKNSHNDGTSTWILRTAGMDEDLKALVLNDGSIDYWGQPCDAIEGCQKTFYLLRPALWLKTSASPTPEPRTCYKVTYSGNNCLAKVPTDSKCYQLGDLVTILFEPVEYMSGLIFTGWDMDNDGTADFGYSYPTFAMPGKDVELKAICYQPYQDQYNNQYYGVTTGEVDPQQYYNPNNDPSLNNDIYDPNTGWWFDPEDYINFYGGVG